MVNNRKLRKLMLVVIAGSAMCLSLTGTAEAAERDLYSGVAHLRAGAQSEAERDLTRYRDEESDAEIRRKIDRVLPLLNRPLTQEVREYVATTIEDAVMRNSRLRAGSNRPNYWSRVFPVFP